MMDFSILNLGVVLTMGLGLGFVYFGGLWLTVRRLPHTRYPGLMQFVSVVVRFALIIAAFYLIIKSGGWQMVLIALAGFTIARLILQYLKRPKTLAESDKVRSQ